MDESTVGAGSGLVGSLSISSMWHIAFATSLLGRPEAKPRGSYLEQMCMLKSRQIFALVTSLQILHKCLGLIARGVSLGGSCAHLCVTGEYSVRSGQDWCSSPMVCM